MVPLTIVAISLNCCTCAGVTDSDSVRARVENLVLSWLGFAPLFAAGRSLSLRLARQRAVMS